MTRLGAFWRVSASSRYTLFVGLCGSTSPVTVLAAVQPCPSLFPFPLFRLFPCQAAASSAELIAANCSIRLSRRLADSCAPRMDLGRSLRKLPITRSCPLQLPQVAHSMHRSAPSSDALATRRYPLIWHTGHSEETHSPDECARMVGQAKQTGILIEFLFRRQKEVLIEQGDLVKT